MYHRGNIGEILVRDEETFVHGQGLSRTQEYHGRKAEIYGLEAGLVADGWEYVISGEGPYRTLTATKQSPADKPNDFYDRFTFNKEIIEKDIWTEKKLHAHQPTTNFLTFTGYRKIIEDAISLGDDDIMTSNFGAYDPANPAWAVYLDLLRGAQNYEDEYLVLTRERVVGFDFNSDLLQIPQANNSLIYTTGDLKLQFGIPDFVGMEWPVDPATAPTNSMWGWRNRRREVRFQEGNRIELVQDWAYAAWSLFAYEAF